VADPVCDYGHTAAEHEAVGACERPAVPVAGSGLLVLDARTVGRDLARHALACQRCGGLVLRNVNAMRRHGMVCHA
jgi:hypothetical protein